MAYAPDVAEAKHRGLTIDDCRVAIDLPRRFSPADWAACANTRDPDGSITACTTILRAGTETKENLAIAFYNRGLAYEAKGDYDHAISDFSGAIQAKPEFAEAYASRGWRYGKQGDYDKSIADCYSAL